MFGAVEGLSIFDELFGGPVSYHFGLVLDRGMGYSEIFGFGLCDGLDFDFVVFDEGLGFFLEEFLAFLHEFFDLVDWVGGKSTIGVELDVEVVFGELVSGLIAGVLHLNQHTCLRKR